MKHLEARFQMSVRRACGLVQIARSLYYYRPHPKTDRDVEIAEVLGEWARIFPYYGFWMLFYRLRIFGYTWNHKPVYRVYRSLNLHLRKRPKRKLPPRDPKPLKVPEQLNDTWSMDFCSDSMAGSRRFRVLSIMDDCSRETLVAEADTSLSSKRVVRILNRLMVERGKPKHIRVDNGPEFIAQAMAKWASKHQVNLAFIQPGRPTQNAYVERLNGTLRREVLDRFWFADLEEVRQKLDDWMIEYNRFRPHKGLGYLSPDLFVQKLLDSQQKDVA